MFEARSDRLDEKGHRGQLDAARRVIIFARLPKRFNSVTSASSKLTTRGTEDQDLCICAAIVLRILVIRSMRIGP